jgi:hypothetical protein
VCPRGHTRVWKKTGALQSAASLRGIERKFLPRATALKDNGGSHGNLKSALLDLVCRGRGYWSCCSFGNSAAGDLGPPPPIETWTGFSVGVGGGVAFLNADVNSKASRTDAVGECVGGISQPEGSVTPDHFIDAPCDPTHVIIPLLDVAQSSTFNINDLSDTGGFFTVQAAYDYQFAPRWVAGAFVDADWSDLSAHAKQTHTFSQNTDSLGLAQDVTFLFGVGDQKTTIATKLSTDWSISVGGRIGWLANPRTLLYFLASYTHQDLSDARVRISIADPIKSFDLTRTLSPAQQPH